MTTRRNRLPLLLSAFALTSVALTASAQVPQRPSQPPPPSIRVTTRMVLVDAVVTDKQGKAVSGLDLKDFLVEENGKNQKISSLVTPAENAPRPPAQLPPGVYSNQSQYRSNGPITVMLLDALNTPYTDQAYARGQMLRFVKEHYKPGERMGVFALTGPLKELQDFSGDPQILYAALQSYKPLQGEFTPMPIRTMENGAIDDRPSGVPPTQDPATASTTVNSLDTSSLPVSDSTLGATASGLPAMTVPQAQAALRAFETFGAQYSDDERAVLTLNALNDLARILGGLPGRKNLIWVTGDVPFAFVPEDQTVSQTELEEALPSLKSRRVGEHTSGNYAATFRELHAAEIRETGARLASAQVAVYPVDARGLSLALSTDSQETMREVARETGGRAFVNQNEIKIGVERAFEDAYASYTLGYYPDNKKYDGQYRQVKVKVKRAGVEVQSRRGYYAIDPTQTKGYDPQAEVASALGQALQSTLIAFSAQVKPPSANLLKDKIGVTFLVDASTLSAEDTGSGKRLNVAMYATVYSLAGKILTNRSQRVDQSFDANTYQEILRRGLMLHMDLDPEPGNNQLRLAVQDVRTGLVGTVAAPAP
jgi:VWFA-related protein